MSKTRIAILSLFATLAIALIFPLGAKAIMFKGDDSTYITKDEVVSSSLFVAGSSIIIDGKVQGDVFCAGQNITINGVVEGDVFCAGQSVTINGFVGGSVRMAGNNLFVNGKVSRNVMAAGANLSIAPEAQVGWDLQFAVAMAEIRGKVVRDVDGAGAKIAVAGSIGRNVYLALDDNREKDNSDNNKPTLTVSKEAVVNGNLIYLASKDASFENGSTIKGTIEKKSFTEKKHENKNGVVAWLWYIVISIFGAIAFGLIIVSWLKKPVEEITDLMIEKPWASLGFGFIFLVLTPIAVILIMITMIGLPIGLTLLGAWILLMYPAKILTAIMLGKKLTDKCRLLKSYKGSLMASMIFGIIVAWLIFSIPVIGWFLCFIALLWGMGGVWRFVRSKA